MNDESTTARMESALHGLNDEIMSMLHSHQLKDDRIDSKNVTTWLRELHVYVQEGLGKESPFKDRG